MAYQSKTSKSTFCTIKAAIVTVNKQIRYTYSNEKYVVAFSNDWTSDAATVESESLIYAALCRTWFQAESRYSSKSQPDRIIIFLWTWLTVLAVVRDEFYRA